MFTDRDLGRANRQRRDAESEAERLRYELEERRRQDERESTEREQRRREAMRAMLPSNRLYNGMIGNAREAMEAHIAALRSESARDIPEPEDSDAPDVLKGNPWPKWIEDAERCLREYDETVGAAERALAERWAKMPEGSYENTFGCAMLNGDYSVLAI